ncbi:unnamed protein product [Cylindrotheca closterium]|uniref:Uncharacterized protein n=1 Tax=Cylindrotheca closterium TaxID=2856 RepID=A0AAD2G3P6_9STRA|nr:unnamed protein product [Cylindrotheca closterium]
MWSFIHKSFQLFLIFLCSTAVLGIPHEKFLSLSKLVFVQGTVVTHGCPLAQIVILMICINVFSKTSIAIFILFCSVMCNSMCIQNNSEVAESKVVNVATTAHAVPLGLCPKVYHCIAIFRRPLAN